MKVKFLADYRGRLTQEMFFTAGTEKDFSPDVALGLINEGRATAVQETPKSEPKPEPAKPTRRRKATKKTS